MTTESLPEKLLQFQSLAKQLYVTHQKMIPDAWGFHHQEGRTYRQRGDAIWQNIQPIIDDTATRKTITRVELDKIIFGLQSLAIPITQAFHERSEDLSLQQDAQVFTTTWNGIKQLDQVLTTMIIENY